ncbi:LOW QUALITY PROTEIN: hypothetical protein V2J09_022530 [Rumex salicifolius]
MSNSSEEPELQHRISEAEPELEQCQEESAAAVDDSVQSNGAIEAKSPSSSGEEEAPKHEQSESEPAYARSDSAAEESFVIVEEKVDQKLPELDDGGDGTPVASMEEGNRLELTKEGGNRTFTMRDLLSGLRNDQGQGSNEVSGVDATSTDSPSSLQKRQILYPDSATAQLINSITGVDDQGRPRQRILAFAAKRFANAIERNPSDYDALYNWALILQESADSVEPDSTEPSKDALLEEACKRYEEATRLCPTLHDAYYNWAIAISDRARLRGRTKEAEEMWKQATKYYEKAVQLNWNSPQALNNWGLALQELSAIVPAKEKLTIVRTAISKFRAAIRLQFDFHRAIYNLGTVLYALAEDMFRVGESSNAKEASSEYLYSQCAIYIGAAYALKPNNSVYRSALRLVRSMLPLPYLKVGYLTAPPPGKNISAHSEWKRTQFVLNHEGLFQLIADDQKHIQQGSLLGKNANPASGRRQPIKVEIPDILSISPSSDLTLPSGAGLFIDTINGPIYLVADSWESLDGWLDAIRLVYTIFAKGKTDEDKNFMHIGGFILARASNEDGKLHRPSPQINPEATAGTMRSAFLVLSLCHTYTTKVPTHISIANSHQERNCHHHWKRRPFPDPRRCEIPHKVDQDGKDEEAIAELQAMLRQSLESFNTQNCHVPIDYGIWSLEIPIRVSHIERAVEQEEAER